MTTADIIGFVAMVSLASALGGALIEYVWHAIHYGHKKGHR